MTEPRVWIPLGAESSLLSTRTMSFPTGQMAHPAHVGDSVGARWAAGPGAGRPGTGFLRETATAAPGLAKMKAAEVAMPAPATNATHFLAPATADRLVRKGLTCSLTAAEVAAEDLKERVARSGHERSVRIHLAQREALGRAEPRRCER